jgi:hypothetical protein
VNRIILFFLLIATSSCFAQFNDSTSYYTSYTSTGLINKTNAGSSYLLNNALKFSVSKKNVSFNNINSWIYGKQLSVQSNNDVSSTADFNVYATFPHFYYWGLGAFDKSYSLKINHRFQTGAGIGYMIVSTKKTMINVSDGILYENGDLSVEDLLGRTNYETFRNSFRLKFRFSFKDKIILDGFDFWQPSLSEKRDYILKSTTSLNIKFQKWLSFTSSLTYNKFNISSRENLTWTFGLTFEKYF